MITYTIGRADGNDIIIDEPSISRRHAELSAEPGGGYRLIDLGSSNGTHIQNADGWVKLDRAALEIETDTPIRLGQKLTTLGELLDLREDVSGADGHPASAGSFDEETDVTRSQPDPAPSPLAPPSSLALKARALPGWAVPAAAIGGGTALVLVVVLVLLLGPFGGAGRSDFVEACAIRSGSLVKCRCWGKALRRGFSNQEFDALTAAIAKRDFLTALAPLLRAKFTRIQAATEAQCGKLGP
ncbi:MAG: FHA domain-containing protein [Alphaproteobacteria bacterium]